MPRIGVTDGVRGERTWNSTRRKARKGYNNTYLDVPGGWQIGGSAAAGVLGTAESVVAFPNAAASAIYMTIRKRSMWVAGGELQVTIFYSGNTSSTATIDLTLGASERTLGDNIAAAHSLTQLDSIAGPASQPALLSHTFSSNLTVGGGGEYLSLAISRDATDNYGGICYITGVDLKYLSRN